MNRTLSRLIAIFITVLLVFQTALLTQAMLNGELLREGGIIMNIPWGRMTLADLYSGLMMWGVLFLIMEKSIWKGIIWWALVLSLGHPITCVWLLQRWWQADQDWLKALTPSRRLN